MSDEEYEHHLKKVHETLHLMRQQYERACKPLIDQLIYLESLRPPSWVVSLADLQAMKKPPH